MFIASDRIGSGLAWPLANSPSKNPFESIKDRAKDIAPEGPSGSCRAFMSAA